MAGVMYVQVSPPTRELPIRESPVRFAVGRHDGASSNSWKLWVARAGDVYVACRDNFRDLKVSLHASGQWRLGLTERAINQRPEILRPGADRAWEKWSRPPDADTNCVVAFEIVFLTRELYLTPEARVGWKPLLFVEPSPDKNKMVIMSVCVVPSRNPVAAPPNAEIAVLGLLPLDEKRSVQLVARYEESASFEAAMAPVKHEGLRRFRETGREPPPGGVVFLVGRRDAGARFVTAVRA